MKVIRGYKTELDSTNEQRIAFMKHCGAARFTYNWGLARSKEVYKTTGKRPSIETLHKELVALKQSDFPWMYEVSKCAIQEALRDLNNAYKNFFRKVALKKQGLWKGKCGFPKFKKRSKEIGSFRLYGHINVFENAVQLPRIGEVKLKERGYIPTQGKILNATVSEKAGRWYISVQMEVEQEPYQNTSMTAIGVDLGIKNLATLSDGKTFANPRALKHSLKKLSRLERQKSRHQKGSQNRKKTRRKIAKVYAHIANIRKDAAHKLTTYMTKNHALVAIEDLHVNGMLKNHKLAQAVSDSNFGEIRQQLEYKSNLYGTHLVVIDRFYPSSKTCSCCGWIATEQSLADRVFVCHDCGYVADRDYNAAKNIVAVGLTDTVNACGENVRRGDNFAVLGEAGTKRKDVA